MPKIMIFEKKKERNPSNLIINRSTLKVLISVFHKLSGQSWKLIFNFSLEFYTKLMKISELWTNVSEIYCFLDKH